MTVPDQNFVDPSNPQRQEQHDHHEQTRSAPSAPPQPPPAAQETAIQFPPPAGTYNIPLPPHDQQSIPNYPPQAPPEYAPPQAPPVYVPPQARPVYAPLQPGQYHYIRPGPALPVLPPANTEGWKTGLFECFDDPVSALMAFFFPCVPFGQIAEIVDNGHTSCSTSGLMYVLVTVCIGLPCILTCSYRAKLRNKFGLVESPGPDWLVHCFCECCAISQAYRELQLRGWDPSIGWEGNVARQIQQRMVPPRHQAMTA
ncbi:protein PLANT CADMIUM RESISTANCE 4-like [Impatiens glandulifera]|uniref:protein PLANT CADMIUM RESISTANCE 4-like n=1 Tax=Impatiens glandulifera TaxID=253017 RepID=UPI001FB1111F|nr:protein PLANT CADMIUM RESISTANCE 4-like [Impatiens glandulifera]